MFCNSMKCFNSFDNIPVIILYSMLLTYDISESHYVVLGQGQCFYLGQFPRLVHVGDYFSQVLTNSNAYTSTS